MRSRRRCSYMDLDVVPDGSTPMKSHLVSSRLGSAPLPTSLSIRDSLYALRSLGPPLFSAPGPWRCCCLPVPPQAPSIHQTPIHARGPWPIFMITIHLPDCLFLFVELLQSLAEFIRCLVACFPLFQPTYPRSLLPRSACQPRTRTRNFRVIWKKVSSSKSRHRTQGVRSEETKSNSRLPITTTTCTNSTDRSLSLSLYLLTRTHHSHYTLTKRAPHLLLSCLIFLIIAIIAPALRHRQGPASDFSTYRTVPEYILGQA